MSFAFGFAGDDIEADDADMLAGADAGEVVGKASQPLIQPKMHTLSDLVSSGRTRL